MDISKPFIVPILGGYKFDWIEGGESVLMTTIKRIYEDSHHAVFGEITVEHDKDGVLVDALRVNLSSPQGRGAIAKRLEQCKSIKLNWVDLTEQVFSDTIKLYRVGDPGETLEVGPEVNIIPPHYLLEPVIMAGVPTIIFGEKGSHKTTLSLLFSICITLPWSDNPFGLAANSQRSTVGILDWESDKRLTMYTLQRLLKGSDLPYLELNYRRCRLPLADDIEQIANFLEAKKCDVVLIDSVGAACGGDLMKAEFALRFFEALRSLNRTSLSIAQTSKSEEGKKTIFGSTYFQYYSRNIFELRKSSDVYDKEETKVALFHNEGNYSGKYDPIGFRLSFSPTSIKVVQEPVDFGEFLQRVNRQQQVIEALKNGPLTTEDIKDKLEISRANADMVTKRLRDNKKIVKTEGGKWGLLIGKD